MSETDGMSYSKIVVEDGMIHAHGNLPKYYQWEPQKDITAYELALCLPGFSADYYLRENFVESLPDEARRHWKEFDPELDARLKAVTE